MLFWAFWAVATVVAGPALNPPDLALGGLAVVIAALLVVVTAGLSVPAAPAPAARRAIAGRTTVRRASRLLDPDAPGRPRPRAPSA